MSEKPNDVDAFAETRLMNTVPAQPKRSLSELFAQWVDEPVDEPAEKPAAEPVEEPVEESVEASAEEPAGERPAEPVEAPARELPAAVSRFELGPAAADGEETQVLPPIFPEIVRSREPKAEPVLPAPVLPEPVLPDPVLPSSILPGPVSPAAVLRGLGIAADDEPALNGRGTEPPVHAVRAPIPVPPEFFDPAPAVADPEALALDPDADPDLDPDPDLASTVSVAELPAPGGAKPSALAEVGAAPAAPAVPATPAEPKPVVPKPADPAAKPESGGFNGPPRWQEHVPFDETGVLLRPESLRAKAMQDETELISAIRIGEDADTEAAKSQRPGFWTGAWPRRALLAVIMLVQALLSLRNNNSPFVDESLYLYSGHLELGQMLHGTSTGIDFWSYFSGAPVLYPPLGALADQIGGIFGARLLSLLFMLGTTGLLYLITRRLFGTRAGLCAAALFSATEATIFLGGLATYDAPALFLLALATWLVVRFAANRFPWYLLAILPAAVAVGTKYVSLLFVPTIFALALLAAAPYSRFWALIRPVLLSLGTAGLLYAGYKMAGTSAAAGISATTTSRAHGTDTVELVMKQAAQYSAVVFVVALFGAVFVVLLPHQHAHPAIARARWQRVLLVLLMAGTALLAPVYQAHLHTAVSLQKHVGFGLFFAAPLAGYGLVRIVGPHFHRLQLGIGVLVLTFAFGMGQSLNMFHSWPNSYASVAELVKYQKPGAHYLFADGPNVIYQLRGDKFVEPSQITDAFSFGWWDAKGKYITGDTAYAEAIQAGYFQVVVYDFTANPGVEQSIAQDLYNSPIYKLVAKIPSPTGSHGSSPAWSYVWVRK